MSRILDKRFQYTPVAKQGPDYLRRKFARILAEQRANAKEAEAKVEQLKPKKARSG